jgi:hypothetical protein
VYLVYHVDLAATLRFMPAKSHNHNVARPGEIHEKVAISQGRQGTTLQKIKTTTLHAPVKYTKRWLFHRAGKVQRYRRLKPQRCRQGTTLHKNGNPNSRRVGVVVVAGQRKLVNVSFA